MLVGCDAVAAGFHAVHGDTLIAQERMEQADGVGATSHAGHQGVGQFAGLLQGLAPGLATDDALEIPHQQRIGVRARHGADDVKGVVDIGHPVAHGLVHRVLEGARARGDGHDFGAQQLHAVHVQGLAAHILLTHEHLALQAEARGNGGRCHAVLAGTGLGRDAGLAHVLGEQRLAHGIVHLVGAGVIQVLALQEDTGPADGPGPAFGLIQGRRPPHVLGQVLIEFPLELGIDGQLAVDRLEFGQRRHQGFCHELAAINTEAAVRIRYCGEHICFQVTGHLLLHFSGLVLGHQRCAPQR